MPWIPSEAEKRRYKTAVDRVGEQGFAVRVLCPTGHLLGEVGVFLLGGLGGSLMLQPKLGVKDGEPTYHRGQRAGLRFGRVATDDGYLRIVTQCSHRGCRYRRQFLHDRLALDVAEAALDGHRDLRLTA